MDKDITLNIVLEHMSSMEQRLSGRITELNGKLSELNGRVTQVHTGLSGQIANLSSVMHAMERRLLTQIDAIDERLDDIEIETLPKRVAQLEKAMRG